MRVLLAGVSTRAAAASAARAGYDVVALDAYADLDQHPGVTARSVAAAARYSAAAAARAAVAETVDAVAYLSNFENHPRAVAALARGRELWGNPPGALRCVRDPELVARRLRERGFEAPRLAGLKPGTTSEHVVPGFSPAGDWMIKPVRSGGGQRVRRWAAGIHIPRGSYLQERSDGVAGSVLFIAAAGRAVPIALSRQLAGDEAFGAAGYRYCGSILVPAGDVTFGDDARLAARAGELCSAVAGAFGLAGINGIDFIARGSEPIPIEVNPRWCASAELVERATGFSVFAAHADSCRAARLPAFVLDRHRASGRAAGKAILFARETVTVGDTRAWLGDATIADVPHPGQTIRKGSPVCTVFAEGDDAADCYARLVERARRQYASLENAVNAVEQRHR